MSEIKRRTKTAAEPEQNEGQKAPRRQTRVTLSKDVSSKYRKIMPKKSSSPKKKSAAASPKKAAAGGAKIISASPAAPRKSALQRPASPRRAAAEQTGLLELRIIIDRELPEAAKQVKEIQNLLHRAATDIFDLTDAVEQNRQSCVSLLNELSQTQSLPLAAAAALAERFHELSKSVTSLYEKMSFHDLAGQRLLKVESFFGALSLVLPALGAAAAAKTKKGQGERKNARPESKAKPAKAEKRLKGPSEDGLKQDEIDRLMAAL